MRIIDPHVHVWKNDPAFPWPAENPNPPSEDRTAEMLLELMAANGVEQTVLVQVIHYRWDNTYVAHVIERYPDRSDLRLLMHAHFAYPLGVVVLLLLGLPLVLKATRRTPFVAAGVSLLLSVAFFATQTVLQDLGGRGEILNPVLGAWLPIILFGAIGLLLFETMGT